MGTPRDELGQSAGDGSNRRRIGLAASVVALFCVAAVLIYAAYGLDTVAINTTQTLPPGVSAISTPGYACDDASLPDSVQRLEATAQFAQSSQGLCYNYIGQSSGAVQGSGLVQYTFNYYNGTVYYPCGTSPSELIVSQIRVTAPGDGTLTSGSSFQFNNETSSLNPHDGCGSSPPPVGVVSAEVDVVTIPAISELNLSLSTGGASRPITGLTAVVIAPGSNETVSFAGVTSSTPALPGKTIFQVELLTGETPLAIGGVYTMSISGAYSNGQDFSYVVRVALVND